MAAISSKKAFGGFVQVLYTQIGDIFGMAIVDENGELVDQALMTLPFHEVEIMDDWNTLGLRGTGSNSIKMQNVFVPDHRVVSFDEALNGNFQSTAPA